MPAPDPAAELDAGRAALVAGALDEAALHFGLALRVAPALAPAVLEATEGARSASLSIVRGDAYRLAGHETSAAQAYAVAAQGGLPERRSRARQKSSALDENPGIQSEAGLDGDDPTGSDDAIDTEATIETDAVGAIETDALAGGPRTRRRYGANGRIDAAGRRRRPASRDRRDRRDRDRLTRPAHPIQSRASSPTVPKVDMPGTERTLVLVKPDGVQRQLVGRILARYEERGLKLVGLKLVRVDRAHAERHYAAHREKPFFAGLVDFIISGPLVALALDGPNAIAVVRAINGATRPARGGARARSAATSPSRRRRTSSTPRTARRRPHRSSRCGSIRPSCSTTSATSIAGCSPRTNEDPAGACYGARVDPGGTLAAALGWSSSLGCGRLDGGHGCRRRPRRTHPADVATARTASSAAIVARAERPVDVPGQPQPRSARPVDVGSGQARAPGVRGLQRAVGPRHADRPAGARSRRAAAAWRRARAGSGGDRSRAGRPATSAPRRSPVPGSRRWRSTIRIRATARIGERRPSPRRSATRPVQKPARMPATQAAKALRATTNARIQIRAGAHAAGSSAASARMTTPASPTIE